MGMALHDVNEPYHCYIRPQQNIIRFLVAFCEKFHSNFSSYFRPFTLFTLFMLFFSSALSHLN